MAIVLTSTTESQQNMDHAVSEKWEDPAAIKDFKGKAEPAPETEVPEQEPVEVPEEPAEPATEPEEPETEVETAPEAKHKRGGVDRRIAKLTARNHQLESRLAEYEAKAKPAEVAAPALGPQEPKFADFGGDLEKFLAHRDAWKEMQANISKQEEMRKAINDAYNEKASKALGEYEDWAEVVSGSKVVLPQDAIDAIKEVDNGPAVAYYLAQHPDEAEALNEFTPKRAVLEIGKIADKLEADKEKPAPKSKAKVQPPAPITPVTSSGTKASKNWWEMSPAESVKFLNKRDHDKRMGKI